MDPLIKSEETQAWFIEAGPVGTQAGSTSLTAGTEFMT